MTSGTSVLTGDEDTELIESSLVREQFSISSMTEWRWVRRGILPEPIRVGGKKYYGSRKIKRIKLGLSHHE